MSLGSSAGRSARNPIGTGARRRFTPREKAQIDPPLDMLHHVHVPGFEATFSTAWAAFALGTVVVLLSLLTTNWLVLPGAVIQILAASSLSEGGAHRLRRGRRIEHQ